MLEGKHLLQSAATTGNGTALQLGGQCDGFRVLIKWSTGVTAGAVVLEEADETSYTGTWSEIATVTYTSGAPKIEAVAQNAGGVQAVRARIGTTVADGTVDVLLTAYSGAGA